MSGPKFLIGQLEAAAAKSRSKDPHGSIFARAAECIKAQDAKIQRLETLLPPRTIRNKPLRIQCGFSDVEKTSSGWQCAKCGKLMPESWVADVVAAQDHRSVEVYGLRSATAIAAFKQEMREMLEYYRKNGPDDE